MQQITSRNTHKRLMEKMRYSSQARKRFRSTGAGGLDAKQKMEQRHIKPIFYFQIRKYRSRDIMHNIHNKAL